MRVWRLTTSVYLSRTSGLSREQCGQHESRSCEEVDDSNHWHIQVFLSRYRCDLRRLFWSLTLQDSKSCRRINGNERHRRNHWRFDCTAAAYSLISHFWNAQNAVMICWNTWTFQSIKSWTSPIAAKVELKLLTLPVSSASASFVGNYTWVQRRHQTGSISALLSTSCIERHVANTVDAHNAIESLKYYFCFFLHLNPWLNQLNIAVNSGQKTTTCQQWQTHKTINQSINLLSTVHNKTNKCKLRKKCTVTSCQWSDMLIYAGRP